MQREIKLHQDHIDRDCWDVKWCQYGFAPRCTHSSADAFLEFRSRTMKLSSLLTAVSLTRLIKATPAERSLEMGARATDPSENVSTGYRRLPVLARPLSVLLQRGEVLLAIPTGSHISVSQHYIHLP